MLQVTLNKSHRGTSLTVSCTGVSSAVWVSSLSPDISNWDRTRHCSVDAEERNPLFWLTSSGPHTPPLLRPGSLQSKKKYVVTSVHAHAELRLRNMKRISCSGHVLPENPVVNLQTWKMIPVITTVQLFSKIRNIKFLFNVFYRAAYFKTSWIDSIDMFLFFMMLQF